MSDEKSYDVIGDSADREKWLEMRQSGIGASDAAAVLGIDPRKGPLAVAADKVGLAEADFDTEWMAAGRRLEPFIAEWALEEMAAEDLARQTDQNWVHVRTGKPCGLLLRSAHFPWMLATPDWWVMEEGGLEVPLQIKNTMLASDWDDGVPEPVKVQVQHEMIVTDSPHAYVAVLLTGNRLRWARIEADPEFQHGLIDATKSFWHRVQTGEPIETDHTASCGAALTRLFPDDSGLTIPLDGDALSLANDLDQVKAKMKELGKIEKALVHSLCAMLGNSTFGTFPDGSGISWKTTERKEYTVKATKFRTLRRLKAKS